MNYVVTRVEERSLTGIRALVASLIGAAFTAACAQVAFYLPGNPVPITLQVFAAVCCGMMLGSRLGAIAQIEYLAAGAAGAPVFAGFKGGFVWLAGPTGGYLVGFVAAAFIIGLLVERAAQPTFRAMCIAGLVGVGIIYIFGRAWLGVWLGDFSGWRSWILGVAPFIGVDALKVAAASAMRMAWRGSWRNI